MFGWSYPPGCSRTPYDEDDGVTELQEKVLELLENANIPTETNDKIITLIAAAELELYTETVKNVRVD